MAKGQQPNVVIVEYVSGRQLTLKEAREGPYVFAIGPDPTKLFAFVDTRRLLEAWADDQGVRRKYNRARRLRAERAEGPTPVVDKKALRAQVKKDDELLKKFAAKHNLAMDDRALLRRAHRARIFDTARLFELPGYLGKNHVFRASCADVTPIFPNGAQSCQTEAYTGVYLYELTSFRPDVFPPPVELVGGKDISLTPTPIRSIEFFS